MPYSDQCNGTNGDSGARIAFCVLGITNVDNNLASSGTRLFLVALPFPPPPFFGKKVASFVKAGEVVIATMASSNLSA